METRTLKPNEQKLLGELGVLPDDVITKSPSSELHDILADITEWNFMLTSKIQISKETKR